jgi:glycosyltransferase involved in cell wall biosynthesis
MEKGLVSVVISTRNEAKNIRECIASVRCQSYKSVEIIVVDNYSTDGTFEIAKALADVVVSAGPERARQRNIGLFDHSSGEYFCYLDADMVCSTELLREAVEFSRCFDLSGVFFEEIMVGKTFLTKVRRLERFLVAGTSIDAIRFGRFEQLIASGGFDECLPPGTEDWDFSRRFQQFGSVGLLPHKSSLTECIAVNNTQSVIDTFPTYVGIFHNEEEISFARLAGKKRYYSESVVQYQKKWGKTDSLVKFQLGILPRLFLNNFRSPRRRLLVQHPLLGASSTFLRLALGINHLISRLFRNRRN